MSKATASVLAVLATVFGAGGFSLAASASPPVVSAPKTITVAISRDSPPFYFVGPQGRARGWVVDIWRLWSRKTGIKVRFLPLSFGETIEAVKDGRADAHGGLFFSPQRAAWLDYLERVCPVQTSFFFHRNIYGLRDLGDLRPYRVGVIKGDYAVEVLRHRQPGLDLRVYPDNRSLFAAVKQGRIRVFVKDTAIALYFLKTLGLLHSYRYHPARPLYQKWYVAAVKKGRTDLARVIRAGMKRLTAAERTAVQRRWTTVTAVKPGLVLTIALLRDRAPLSMLTPDGRPAGLLVDLWRLWAGRTGQRIEFRFDRSDRLELLVRRGQVDVIGGLDRGRLPGSGLAGSRPVLAVTDSYFYRLADGPLRLADLERGRVGVISGSGAGSLIKKRYPSLSLVRFPTVEALVSALAQGRVKVAAGGGTVLGTAIDRLGLSGAIVRRPGRWRTRTLVAAVSRSRPGLLKMVNRGLALVSSLDRTALERRWIRETALRQYTPTPGRVGLTSAEKAYLQSHAVIRVGVDPAWPPFDFLDDQGKHRGMAADYLALLGRRLGIEFKIVIGKHGKPLTWNQVMELARQRKLDVVACLTETPDRRKFLSFTRPYIEFPWVVVTRKDHPTVAGIQAFYGQRVAVVKGYAIAETLARAHPGLKLVQVDSPLRGLEAVATGRVEAYAGSLAVVAYLIQGHNLSNLKVAAPAGGRGDRLRLGVRPDWLPLVTILDKGLASISPAERAAIHRRWFRVKFERGVDWGLVWRMALLVALVAVMILIVIFIWNRRLAREAAIRRRAEERFQSIAANVPGAIFRGHITPDGTREFTYVSDRLTEFFGLTPEQLLDDPDNFHVLGEDRPRFFQSMDEAVATGRDWDFVGRMKTPSGETKWFRIAARTERTADQGTLFNGLLLDVTARKRAELEYLATEKKIRAMSQAVTDSLVMLDRQGLVRFWNQAAERLFGYSAEEAMGLDFHTLAVPPEFRDKAIAGIDRFGQTGEGEVIGTTMETTGLKRSGEAFPAEVSVSSFQLDDEWFAVGSVRDITERQRGEEALRHREAYLRAIFDSSSDPVMTLDGERRVTGCNGAFIDLFGYSREEIVGRSLRLIHLDDERFAAFRGRVYPQLAETGSWRSDWPFRTKQGRTIPMEVVISTIWASDGSVMGYLGIMRDVTERQKAEEELRESERRLIQIIDFLPDPTWVIDADHRVVAWNRAMETMTGVKAGDMVGRGDYEYSLAFYGERRPALIDLVLDWDEAYEEKYLSVKRVGQVLVSESYHPQMGPNGTYLSGTAAVLYDAQGNVVGAIESLRDTSERKRSEEDLRDREKRLGQIIGFLPDPTWVIDTEHRVVAWNRAVENMTGIKAEDMLGRGDYEYGLAFYGERRPMLIDLVLDWDESYVERYISIKRSGDRLLSESYNPNLGEGGTYLEGTATALYDAQGRVVGAIETVRDITPAKRAEEAIRKREAHLRALVDSSGDSIIVMDNDRTLIDCNPAFTDQFGYTREEVVGQSVALLHRDQESYETFGRMIYPMIQETGTWRGEWVLKRKDGSTFPVESVTSAERLPDGSTIGFVGVIRDITEQKRAAEALRKSEENLRALVQSSVDPIITLDTERNVTDSNQAYLDLFGYTLEEIIGHSVKNIHVDEEHFIDFGRAVYPEVSDTGGWRGEWPYKAKDGRLIPMETAISAIRLPDGSIEGFVAILRDITERKRAEKELKQNLEDLERFSRLTVGREEKMIQLKEEINRLSDRLGEGKKYKIVT